VPVIKNNIYRHKSNIAATLFERHGTAPAAALLHWVSEKHDCSEAVFLADAFGYLILFSRLK